MTLLDSLRDRVRADSRPETGSDAEVLEAPSGLDWWQAPAAGASPRRARGWCSPCPPWSSWVATAHTTVGWGDALGIASAGWFLGHGASVAVGELSLSLAPLGLWLLALLLTVRGARRLLDRTERSAPGTTWPRALVRQVVPGFVLGYAAAGLLAWLLTLAGPARPGFAAVLVVSASRSSRSRGRCSGATSPARSAAWSASGSTGCRAGCRGPSGRASTALPSCWGSARSWW